MKTLSLLIAAGALATTFSGCYLDHQPTMTLEERMMADDRDAGEMPAVKTRPATCAEYGGAQGRPTRVDAFTLNLESGKSYGAFFFIKHHDLASGAKSVESLGEAVLIPTKSPVTMFCELAGGRFVAISPEAGLNFKAADGPLARFSEMMRATELASPFNAKESGDLYLHAEGDMKPGARLAPPSGASGRFLIRNVGFAKYDKNTVINESLVPGAASRLVGTSGIVFEVECILVPYAPGFYAGMESARLKTFLDSTWATPGAAK